MKHNEIISITVKPIGEIKTTWCRNTSPAILSITILDNNNEWLRFDVKYRDQEVEVVECQKEHAAYISIIRYHLENEEV